MKYKSNRNIVFSCSYHVVFCPKYRRPVLVDGVDERFKGRSSHDLREEFPWLKSRIPTLWTNSYFVSTVGGAPLAQVRKYIERQKEV